MKKLFTLFLVSLFIVSCSIVPKTIVIPNYKLNRLASRYINVDKNLVFANISLKNLNTEVKNGKVYSQIEYVYSILGGLLTNSSGVITIVSDVKVEDNKLYAIGARVIDIISDDGNVEDQRVAKSITNVVLNILTTEPLHDFNSEYYVKNIYLTSSNMVIETK